MNILDYINANSIFIFIFILILICIILYFLFIYEKKQNIYKNGITIPAEILTKDNKLRGTILDILKKISLKYPNLPALMTKHNNSFNTINYREYYNKVLNFAESVNYWLNNKVNVAILGANSTGWFYSHLGTMLNGGTSIGLYPTSSPNHIEYVLEDSDANILIVDGTDQLDKLININLYDVKMIIYYSPISETLLSKFNIPVVSMGNFMSQRKKLLSDPQLSDIATIIYTSGTTGNPKGAIITHKNIMASTYSIINDIQDISNHKLFIGEKFISYLPLNHILAQQMDIYIPISTMGKVCIADKDVIKHLADTIKLIKPNIFVGVPRIWEKISESIDQELINQGYKGNLVKLFNKKKIIERIGLDECKLCITSGAPLSQSIKDYFINYNLNIYDVYGMTEATGPITISCNGQYKKNSVGKNISSIKLKIEKDGEILIKGPTVFKGYYKNENDTKKSFKDGWFKTGDTGFIDNDGFLFINGRKKDIIITKGGENITPHNIEFNLKQELPFLNYIIVVGDDQKYLSALFVLKTKNDNKLDVGKKSSNELNLINNEIKKIDSTIKNIDDAIKNKNLSKIIQEAIDKVNKKAQNNSHHIKKWIIIPNTFNINEELTPTLKVKRQFIYNKYKELIESIYK